MMGGPSRTAEFAPPLAKKHQCNLFILGGVHLVMMIALMVSFHGAVGFGELINCMFLMCGAYSMNFCLMILYIIIMMNNVVTYFAIVGLAVQDNYFA